MTRDLQLQQRSGAVTCSVMDVKRRRAYFIELLDSLRGSSVKIGTIQRRLAWPLRKDDTHKSRSVNKLLTAWLRQPLPFVPGRPQAQFACTACVAFSSAVCALVLLHCLARRGRAMRKSSLSCSRGFAFFWVRVADGFALQQKVTLSGLEPAIFGSEDQRLIH